MVTKRRWRPDFTKANPYEGMPPDYAERVAQAFIPTAGQPYSPIEKAIQQGRISKELTPIISEPVIPIPPIEPVIPITPTPVTTELIPIPETGYTLNEDYSLLYKEYQRTGGGLDVSNWIFAGTPIRPEFEYQEELGILSEVYAKYPGYRKEDVPLALAELRQEFSTDPARFLEDLTIRTTPENVGRVFGMLGITQDMLLATLPAERQDQRITDTIQKMFPDYSIEDFNYLLENEPETFIKEIQTYRPGGATRLEKQQLLEMIGFEPDYIDQILGVFVTIDGVRQMAFRSENNELYDTKGNFVGFYDWSTHDVFNPYRAEGLGGKFKASLLTGIGDVLSTAGGSARWLGYEEVGASLSEAGRRLQRYAVPITTEFQVFDLLDPEFYATKIARPIPFALSLMPLAVGGYYGGVTLATLTGLGTIWTAIIGGLTGGVLSRSAESALEAGSQYDDAIARGKSDKEAKEEAIEVFRNNMILAGADAWEIAIALAPTPKWVPASLVKSGLVRTVRIGGKMVIVGLSEGGEELYQDMIQRHARGEEWQLDPVAKEVFAIGAVMGVGMGLGGDVISGIVSRSQGVMPPSIKNQFDQKVAEYLQQGFTKDQADLRALNDVSAINPDFMQTVRGIIQEIKTEPERGAIIPGAEPRGVIPTAPIPSNPEVVGKQISEQLGVKYDGVQEGFGDIPAKMQFTDPQTGSTTYGNTLEEVKANLTKMRQKFAVTQEAGQPEAGYQPAMIEGVTEREVRPAGKGKIVQISMEEQLKLEQARKSAEAAPEEVREAYEAQVQIEGIKATHQADPVASLRFKIGNRSYSIDNIVDAKEKTFAYNDSFILSQAKAIKPNVVFSEANKLPNGRIRADAVLDELADRYTDGDVNAFIARVNQIRQEKARIRELERQAMGVEVGLPYLSIPEETTLPVPDEVTASADRVVMPPPPPKEPPPPEPPPTHPPQPAPIEAGRITMPDLQAPQTVVDMYSKPNLWRRVANLPLVRKAVGLFDPAAVANNPAQQAIILRAALKDEGAQKAQAVMSHLWEIGTQERVWGKTDEYGYLKAEAFAGNTIDDIRTNPAKFLPYMDERQKEWIKRASEIEKVKLEALKRNGIEINELSFEDGGEYAGRRVMGKFNDAGELIESGHIAVGGRVGARQAFEKARVFKTAEEGILAGYRYMNSDEALYYNTVGAYNKIADRQMADWILSKVDWRTTAAPETLVLQAEAARLRLRKAQQLAAALNRAVRGERVPSNTINSIASVYADQADTLKTLIPELQKPSPETGEIVQTLDREAKALISEARLEYYQAVNERARAREEAMRVKYEEASIAHPAFAGKIFTGAEAKEIADILNRGLSPQFIEALGAVNKVNAIGRFFMLAGDVSPMTIQLQFLAFYRPVAYGKAMGGFVRAMFDPEFQYRYYANNRELINRHPTLILSGRGTEFTEFMGRGGLGKKLGVLAKPLVPFQHAFEGSLDVAGIELAKSLDHRCTTPEATLQVDQFINEFRGLTSSARIGVSSTQRQAETAMLLAPRYNRAIAAYLFDIVHGGLRGELARMSLAQGLAGISAMAVAVSIALGEDEDDIWQHFDPTSPKFFTWNVMGVKIGLGGKVRSVLKTFGNMLRNGEVGQPALNFLRGNLSPGASTSLDLITGKDYIGDPTRDNVLDFTKTILQNFMMIWTQIFLMEGGTLKDKTLIATTEFLGLRGYDISARKELKIKDLEERLGEVVGKTPVLTKKKPDIYDTRNIFSDVKNILKNILPEEVLADKGYAGWGHLVVQIQQSEANSLPNIAFKDYNFDKAKGDTLDSYMAQWAERQRIEEAGERATYTRVKIVEGKEERTTFKGLEALNAHKVDYPNAQRGNLTKRERELLLEYNIAADKKQFIKEHPEIKINRYIDWMKANPRENALFALVGLAHILSEAAYNEFQKIIKEMDIPDAAILPMTLPPEGSVDAYFERNDIVNEWGAGSWEDQLVRAKNPELNTWLELGDIDTPIASLELKTEETYRATYNKLNDEDDPDWVGNLDDTIKDKDGLTERDRARAELKGTKIPGTDLTYRDMERKIVAIEKGTDEEPIPDETVNAYIEYYQIVDQTSGNSAESKLYRYDNSEHNDFLMNEDYWDKPAEPLDEDTFYLDNYLVPRWRIDVQYSEEDMEYQAILDRNDSDEGSEEAVAYLANNEDYRKARRRRQAFTMSNTLTGERFPLPEIEDYVGYYELPIKGFRQERFLIENGGQDPDNLTGFALAMHTVVGRDIPHPEDVPSVEYDDIYDQYPNQFDRLEGLADNTSPYYIEDPTERERIRQGMRFTIGAQNYSGVRTQNKVLTEFGLADIRRDAYGKFVPDQYIEDYVGYYKIYGEGKPKDWADQTGTNLWFEDDWFMMEHLDFYREVYINQFGNERLDFTEVPSREVFNLYLTYLKLPSYGTAKENFRLAHLDLDDWGVIAFDWKPITQQKVGRLTQEQEWERELKTIENILAGLR